MATDRSVWQRGFSVGRSLVGGLALLMAITGCAHLANSPAQTSTTGSPPRPDAAAPPSSTSGQPPAPEGESAQANSVKNEPNNSSVAKAQDSAGGTAKGTKIPSPGKGVSDKGQPRPAAPPTLGLSDIEQRLRDTHAIGVFTKLSLKNQIDDLLGQLRAYQLKPTVASLPELRHRYDELLQKVIGLLRSGDPSLAKDISSSREAIWSLLTNSTTISQL
jgi:hypothetical protein